MRYFDKFQIGPARVEDLRPFALKDTPLDFACPTSGKPYLCAPRGLTAPGEAYRIYIYDAEPAHKGERWCACSEPGRSTGAAVFFAEHIPEERFQKFLANSAK